MRLIYLLLACLCTTASFAQTDCTLSDPPVITGSTTFCANQTLTYRPAAPLPGDPQCGPLTYTWTVQNPNPNSNAPLPMVLSNDGDSLVLQFSAMAPSIGVYQLGLEVANDSSSIAAAPLLLTENALADPEPEALLFCLGDSVFWEGQYWLPTSGELLVVSFANPNGCDSIVTGIPVPILPSTSMTEPVNCCGGDPDCPEEGLYQTNAGPGFNGCDSTTVTQVIHFPSPQTDLDTLVLAATDTLVVGGTTYTNLDAGSYEIVLDSYLGCDSTVRFVIVDASTTATDEVDTTPWQLAPNPTTGAFTLHLDAALPAGTRLHVHDATGRLRSTHALRPGVQRIDLGALPAGVYLLSYRTADGRYRSTRLLHTGP